MKKTADYVYDFDKPGELLTKVRNMINNDPRSFSQLSHDTRLPPVWIRQIADGAIVNPSVNRVEWLYNALSKDKLRVK